MKRGCRLGQMEAASAPTSHSRCSDVGHLAASRGINALPGIFQAQFQELGGGADHSIRSLKRQQINTHEGVVGGLFANH